MVLWHSKRPFTCATAALGYCCLHDSLRDRQNAAKENLPVPHDKNKTKKPPQNYRVCSGQRNTNSGPFTRPLAWTNANFYVKGPLCHITMTPLVDIQITAPCSQQKCISHNLMDNSCTFCPSKCALAVRGPAYIFLFNQWSKTPQSTFKKQPTKTKKNKLQLAQ